MRSFPAFLLALLLTHLSVTMVFGEIQDKRDSWTLGVSEFSREDLPEELSYLGSGFPNILLEQISQVTNHIYSTEERSAYQLYLIESTLDNLNTELTSLLSKRDRDFIESALSEEQKRTYEEKADVLRKSIEEAEGTIPSEITIDTEKPVILAPENQGGELLYWDDDFIKTSGIHLPAGLDCYITGKFRYLQGFVDVSVWVIQIQGIVYQYQDLLDPEILDETLEKLAGKITAIIFGKEGGRVAVQPEPRDARVQITRGGQEIAVGTGDITSDLLDPGVYEVSVNKNGYIAYQEKTEVITGVTTTLSPVLTKLSGTPFLITSYPGNADVYLDSLWLGKTPLVLDCPEEGSQIVIRKEDFLTWKSMHQKENEIKIFLKEEFISHEEELKMKRDAYYASFGRFILSLPLTIVSYANAVEYANLAVMESDIGGTDERIQELQNTSLLWYTASQLGLWFNAFLFGNTVIDVLQFIQAVEN